MLGLGFVRAFREVNRFIAVQMGDLLKGFLGTCRLPPFIQCLQALGVIQVMVSEQALVVMCTESKRKRSLHVP